MAVNLPLFPEKITRERREQNGAKPSENLTFSNEKPTGVTTNLLIYNLFPFRHGLCLKVYAGDANHCKGYFV